MLSSFLVGLNYIFVHLAGDLDPATSKHTLVPLKVAYKKLRLLVDLGCVFVGHGLKKDFRIISMPSLLHLHLC